MKMKSLVLLIVALGCGLVAMLGVQQVMSGPQQPEQQQPDTKKVLVASKDIQPFSLLDDSNTELKSFAVGDAPEGAISSRAECADARLRYFAAKGDVIQFSKLTSKNYAPSQEIDPGMRVVTVKVNATKTHSGLIRPADHVDVILTYKYSKPGMPSRQRTVTILKDVKVFSIDDKRQTNVKDLDGNDLKAKNISLSVTPAHGNLLMLAENRGILTLALRRSSDKEPEGSTAYGKGVSVDDSFLDNLDQPADANRGKKAVAKTGGFGSFLAGDGTGKNTGNKPAAVQKSKADSPAKPKWKLTIYEGKTPRIEEVELPDADDDKGKSSKDGQTGRKPVSGA